jgi:hypothetical protein
MKILDISASFTRPANTTAYASGNLVANSTTAGSVTPLTFNLSYGQFFKIYRASITMNSAVNTNAKFLLHLYGSSPTPTNGDGAAWLTTSSNYQGNIAIDSTLQTFSDNLKGSGVYVNTAVWAPWVVVSDSNYKLYGLLAATAAYVPTSGETVTVNLIGECYA